MNKLLMSAGIAAVAAVSLMGPAAQAQSDNWNALYDRIIRLEHQIKSLKGAGGGTSGGGATGASQGGDQSYRLSAIEDQLRRLLASVDAMRDQMRDMQGRIKKLEKRKSSQTSQPPNQVTQADTFTSYGTSSFEAYTDENSDLDLTVLPEDSETHLSGTTGTTGSIGTGETIDSTQPQVQFEAAPQQQVLGQLIIENDGALPGNGQAEASSLLPGQVESAALDNPTPSTGNSNGGTGGGTGGGTSATDDLYEKSYKNLLSRRFGMAEAGFKTFITQNPKHPSVSKARYWLGETYYVQGRYKQAAQSFLTGYRSHPKGARAPESLLKLGMSLNKLGQKKQACGAYAEVRRAYPSAKKTTKLAVRESKRAGCS